MINVTKTFLPPFEEYQILLKKVWDNHWLTNRGPLVCQLEDKLKDYLQISSILMTNNGTVPLQIALKILGNNGEIITTPFSYVATTSSIVWENCTPVFVDIDKEHFTIDENKIEEAITSKTTAILATHVFGNPCNVEKIEQIAKKFNLSVIYDGAHSFGVKYKEKSLLSYGDIATCSFHATKIFHTGEGGAIIANNKELEHTVFYSHNFGHNGPLSFYGLGINAKISELQAAMGLSIYPYIEFIFNERKKVVDFYDKNLNFSILSKMKIREKTAWNYSYYPVLFKSEKQLLEVQAVLNQLKVFPRRYFYPSLNLVPYVTNKSMPISEDVSSRILCLPLYVGLTESELHKIVNAINKSLL
jgi:dTDP-4-amino-4,6-dideoxygalactose transaminase